jgi:hypothetical protein
MPGEECIPPRLQIIESLPASGDPQVASDMLLDIGRLLRGAPDDYDCGEVMRVAIKAMRTHKAYRVFLHATSVLASCGYSEVNNKWIEPYGVASEIVKAIYAFPKHTDLVDNCTRALVCFSEGADKDLKRYLVHDNVIGAVVLCMRTHADRPNRILLYAAETMYNLAESYHIDLMGELGCIEALIVAMGSMRSVKLQTRCVMVLAKLTVSEANCLRFRPLEKFPDDNPAPAEAARYYPPGHARHPLDALVVAGRYFPDPTLLHWLAVTKTNLEKHGLTFETAVNRAALCKK